jgi:hypothetical protein
MATYEFAIQKNVLNSGKIIYTPVCRVKSLFGNKIFPRRWERITKIYDNYILLDLDFMPELTFCQCQEHISAYKQILRRKVEKYVDQVDYHELEEEDI